jgi:hypothetical protein
MQGQAGLRTRLGLVVLFLASLILVWFFLALPSRHVYARDLDGKYKDSPLHAWFDSLASKKGLCCSFADGRTVEDPDVQMDANHYRVRVDGEWVDVPDDALVTVPNKFGQAVVWPYNDWDADGKKHIKIRCFMPGAGT